MRAIILAAGGGTRLRPYTEDRPKCLVSVNGVPIIQNALDALCSAGCSDVCVVVGHRASVLQQWLGSRYQSMHIAYVLNKDWGETNSMFSLHLGLAQQSPRFVIEGDVFFDPAIIQAFEPEGLCWLVDARYRSSDGAYLRRASDGHAEELQIVKRPEDLTSAWAKSVGILMMDEGGADRLREWLRLGVTQNKRQLYYDLIIAEHLHEHTVQTFDVAPARWWEIDTPEDLANAERTFS